MTNYIPLFTIKSIFTNELLREVKLHLKWFTGTLFECQAPQLFLPNLAAVFRYK